MTTAECVVAITYLGIIVFGMIVVSVGLDSHEESAWTIDTGPYEDMPFYEYTCKALEGYDEPCPDIEMELFYLRVIELLFILSIIAPFCAIVSFIKYGTKPSVQSVVAGPVMIYAVSVFFLIAGAITYLISANQIQALVTKALIIVLEGEDMRTGEKRLAAGLTIVHAILNGVAAISMGVAGYIVSKE